MEWARDVGKINRSKGINSGGKKGFNGLIYLGGIGWWGQGDGWLAGVVITVLGRDAHNREILTLRAAHFFLIRKRNLEILFVCLLLFLLLIPFCSSLSPNNLSIFPPVKGESATSPSLIPKLPPSLSAKLPLHDLESFSETPQANQVPLFSFPKVPVVHS